MLPWGDSRRQVRLPPAPVHRNLWAKLQQQVGYFSPFICQISRSGISKDQVLTGLPHKKKTTVHVRNNSNYCQWNFLPERPCSPQPWALGMTYGQRRNSHRWENGEAYTLEYISMLLGTQTWAQKYFWQKAGKLVSQSVHFQAGKHSMNLSVSLKM